MIGTRIVRSNGHIRRSLAFFLCTLLLLWVFFPHAYASAQEEEESLIKTDRRLPMLNGHRFVLSSSVMDPFITSFVQTRAGFGLAPGVDITLYDFNGNPLATIRGDLAYMLLGMEYRQSVARWLSLWVGVDGLGRMGVNAESLLSQGITGIFAFELGGLARLWQNDRFQLSASAGYRGSQFIGVDILTFVKRIIDDGGIAPDNKITDKIPTDRFSAGLHFAFAPRDWVGLMAAAELGTTDSIFDLEKNATILGISGLASFDLNPGTSVPLGFNLGFRYNSYPEGGDDLAKETREVLFKIAYTGRREFSLGLEGKLLRAPLREEDKSITSWSAYLVLSYYF